MFTFALAPDDLFAERGRQFRGWGIPDQAIDAAEASVTDMWADGPGGWTTEWCRQAGELEKSERWLDAALTYGAARFPCLATTARVAAYERQLALFAQATDGSVGRELVPVTYRSRQLALPVHRYPAPRARATLLLTGGVDTWKVELHRMATALQQLGELDVVVFDMPGTGECDVALAPDADVVYAQVADAVRAHERPDGPIGVMGISFGGLWAAKLALRRQIDFAVDVGGPVGAQHPAPRRPLALPNGMTGIVAHALRLDGLPAPDEVPELLDGFSLAGQGLLGPDRRPAPLLVLNGTDDVYVPTADSTVFEQYPQAEVHLFPGAGHCAAERITDVVGRAIAWIGQQTAAA
jgi:esterase FrsA